MSEVELHINVSGVGKPEQVARLIEDAMALSKPEIKTVIPVGYRCVECFQDDGEHESTCQFRFAVRGGPSQ